LFVTQAFTWFNAAMRRKRGERKGASFWNKEYSRGAHLALSTAPSEDLQKFMRWLERADPYIQLPKDAHIADLGCGNGRNLIYLAKEYGYTGTGYDISGEAVQQAERLAQNLPCTFTALGLSEKTSLPDNSQDLVLDMMASHVLTEAERSAHLLEVIRILKPGGWFFYKTFLLDGDLNAKRLLRDHPADEPGSYIHPKMGVLEHVFTEKEIRNMLESDFSIHRILKSHRHLKNGRAHKRRSVTVYAQKIG
jgi:SAM-dependent methyltransferase